MDRVGITPPIWFANSRLKNIPDKCNRFRWIRLLDEVRHHRPIIEVDVGLPLGLSVPPRRTVPARPSTLPSFSSSQNRRGQRKGQAFQFSALQLPAMRHCRLQSVLCLRRKPRRILPSRIPTTPQTRHWERRSGTAPPPSTPPDRPEGCKQQETCGPLKETKPEPNEFPHPNTEWSFRSGQWDNHQALWLGPVQLSGYDTY